MKEKNTMSDDLRGKSINSFAWKSAQSVCSLGITFVIQLVLARMLLPEDFGIIAISTVFMTLANTVIETSFSSAVIQRNSLSQKLLSSIFYANFLLSLLVYVILFEVAPFIAEFYSEPLLIPILRVQGLRVVVSGLYSIQQAIMNRKMRFKALFYCNLIGSLCQAVIGLIMAHCGMGIWALVVSTSLGCVVTGTAIMFVERWKPEIYFSFELVREALLFSSKILVVRVMRKIFYNIRVLMIGRVYNTEILGYFNKGFQFPSTAMTVVDGSLTSVAFTHLAKLQNDKQSFIATLRQYVRIAMFVCTPIMIGMALIAEPLVLGLLTERWVECVPYLQIICISQLFVPLNLKTTAFEALGDSDLSMRLNLTGIFLSVILLVMAIPFSPLIMTFTGVISNIMLHVIITISTKKHLDYSIGVQVKDALCSLGPTLIMSLIVLALGMIDFEKRYFVELFVKMFAGSVTFVFASIIMKNEEFYSVVDMMKARMRKGKDRWEK